MMTDRGEQPTCIDEITGKVLLDQVLAAPPVPDLVEPLLLRPVRRWRPSMFCPPVVHLTLDGQSPKTSAEYPGEPWVLAACGQKVAPHQDEAIDSARCPECLAWLRRADTTKSPRPDRPEPDGAGA